MILNVSVTEYRPLVTAHELGLARDTHTVARLRQRYAPSWFSNPSNWVWRPDLDAAPGFQHYVDKYAESSTLAPWEDVILFFNRLAAVSGTPITPGPLYYPARYPLLNTAAMASATEALAGWFCEQYHHWSLISRPARVTPDLLFRDPTNHRWALIEVKSSGKLGDVKKKLTTFMIKLLPILASTKLLRPNLYYAGVILAQVASPTDVHLTSLILEET